MQSSENLEIRFSEVWSLPKIIRLSFCCLHQQLSVQPSCKHHLSPSGGDKPTPLYPLLYRPPGNSAPSSQDCPSEMEKQFLCVTSLVFLN